MRMYWHWNVNIQILKCEHTDIARWIYLHWKVILSSSLNRKSRSEAALSLYHNVCVPNFYCPVFRCGKRLCRCEKKRTVWWLYAFRVVPGGLEPPLTEPKTVVLPLHHRTNTVAKIVVFRAITKFFAPFFHSGRALWWCGKGCHTVA